MDYTGLLPDLPPASGTQPTSSTATTQHHASFLGWVGISENATGKTRESAKISSLGFILPKTIWESNSTSIKCANVKIRRKRNVFAIFKEKSHPINWRRVFATFRNLTIGFVAWGARVTVRREVRANVVHRHSAGQGEVFLYLKVVHIWKTERAGSTERQHNQGSFPVLWCSDYGLPVTHSHPLLSTQGHRYLFSSPHHQFFFSTGPYLSVSRQLFLLCLQSFHNLPFPPVAPVPFHFSLTKVHLKVFSIAVSNLFLHVLSLSLSSEVFQRRQWHPTPVLLPGESHGQRSLVGCSPWGH